MVYKNTSVMEFDNWTLVKKRRKKKTFARSFLWLVTQWIKWRIDTNEDLKSLASLSNTAMQCIWEYLNRWIKNEIEFLRTKWKYSEDHDFLMFLRMLMPCTKTISPIRISHNDLIEYRERQHQDKCNKKLIHNLMYLCKNQNFSQEIATIISQFVPLMLLDFKTHGHTNMVKNQESRTNIVISCVFYEVTTLDISPTYCNKYTDQLYYLIDQLEWHNNEIKELESLESLELSDFSDTASSRSYISYDRYSDY